MDMPIEGVETTSPAEAKAIATELLTRGLGIRFNEALRIMEDFPANELIDYSPEIPRRDVSVGLYRNPAAPPVMLAEKWSPECPVDPTGYWMSEKLDGVRAYWNGRQLISRRGNIFAAPKWFTDCLPDVALDGELYMGRGMFNETSGIVRREKPHAGWRYLVYFAFDLPEHRGSYEARQAELERVVQGADCVYLRKVPSIRVQGRSHVERALAEVEKLRGEGVMLVKPGSRYEGRRTACLLKVKTFHDAEAVVVGYEPGKGRHKGRLGALIVEKGGMRFKVGTGLSDVQRERAAELFPLGTTITYRYFELTPKGVPRFPSFIRVRADEPRRSNAMPVAKLRRRVLR